MKAKPYEDMQMHSYNKQKKYQFSALREFVLNQLMKRTELPAKEIYNFTWKNWCFGKLATNRMLEHMHSVEMNEFGDYIKKKKPSIE